MAVPTTLGKLKIRYWDAGVKLGCRVQVGGDVVEQGEPVERGGEPHRIDAGEGDDRGRPVPQPADQLVEPQRVQVLVQPLDQGLLVVPAASLLD